MDYSTMSDFEINKLVSISLGYSIGGEKYGKSSVGLFYIDGIVYKSHDYCNNPADAWQIINENKISTMWMTSEKEWCAWANGDLEEGTWDWENVPDYYFNCESQLRAAMIVFLMMQEAK